MEYSLGDGTGIRSSCKVDRVFMISQMSQTRTWKSNMQIYASVTLNAIPFTMRSQGDVSKFKFIQFMEELLILQMELNIGQQALPKSKPLHTI